MAKSTESGQALMIYIGDAAGWGWIGTFVHEESTTTSFQAARQLQGLKLSERGAREGRGPCPQVERTEDLQHDAAGAGFRY